MYHIVYQVGITGDEYNDNKTTEANAIEFGELKAGKNYNVSVFSIVNETIMSDEIHATQWTSKKFVLRLYSPKLFKVHDHTCQGCVRLAI